MDENTQGHACGCSADCTCDKSTQTCECGRDDCHCKTESMSTDSSEDSSDEGMAM